MARRFPPVPGGAGAMQTWVLHAQRRIQDGEARKAVAVAPLSLTVSANPTQAEVQAVAGKTDELLAALKAANLMESET